MRDITPVDLNHDVRFHRILQSTSLSEREIKERFVRASGPGGQNVRNEATAVELRVDLARSSMPLDVRARLIALAGRHVTKNGVLVVVSRALRSQVENRQAVRAELAAFLERAAKPPKVRKGTKSLPGAREERLVSKHRRSAVKRTRGADDEI
jgi:ribosome-associated protein